MTKSLFRLLLGGFLFGHLRPSQKLLVTALVVGRKRR